MFGRHAGRRHWLLCNANNELRCQGIDLIVVALGGLSYQVQNLGGNACGCGDSGECVLESGGFDPPASLGAPSQ